MSQETIGDLNYGGRVTDDKDLRTLEILCRSVLRPNLLSDHGLLIGSGGMQVAPSAKGRGRGISAAPKSPVRGSSGANRRRRASVELPASIFHVLSVPKYHHENPLHVCQLPLGPLCPRRHCCLITSLFLDPLLPLCLAP